GCLDTAHAEGCGHAILDRARGGITIERSRAAEEEVRIEVPEHQIRVGDRGLVSPESVAGWSRLGAGAVGADAQDAALDASHAASAGSDLDQIDAWHVDGEAAAVAHAGHVHFGAGRAERLPRVRQARL